MTPILMILILIASILQRERIDILTALTFSLPMVSLWAGSDFIVDDCYYHLNAMAALSIIFALNRIKTKISLLLSKALLLSIFINCFGYISWFYYLDPSTYDILFTGFYIWVLYIMLKKGSFQWNVLTLLSESYSSLRSLFAHGRG